MADQRVTSALPPRTARILAVAAIVIAGALGALIGYAFVDLQCPDGCATWAAVGGLVGAIFAAVGVAVVAVLTLRAMDEWNTVKEREALAKHVGDSDAPR